MLLRNRGLQIGVSGTITSLALGPFPGENRKFPLSKVKKMREFTRIVWMVAIVLTAVFPDRLPAAPLLPSKDIPGLEQKAGAGDPKAQNALADFYFHGRVVSKDLKKAFFWYRKAARKGDRTAERNLGWAYWHGSGTAKDPVRARTWLRKAARAGDGKSMNLLGAFLLSVKDQDSATRAAVWFRKGAQAGNREAMFNLGALYDRGEGVPLDYGKAAHWWKKAARRGDTAAQTGLGDLYEKGLGVPRDYGLSTYWEQKAASVGDPLAREASREGPWTPMLKGPSVDGKKKFFPSPVSQALTSGVRVRKMASPKIPPRGDAKKKEAGPDPWTEVARLREEIGRLVAVRTGKTGGGALLVPEDQPSYRLPAREDDFAVVVGVERYPGGVPDALFADRDARAVYRHLVALGVMPEHIRLLFDGEATRGGIDAAVRWLSKNVTKRSTVYFYYSGHGVPTAKGASDLAPSGILPEDLSDTAYPLTRLYKKLTRTGAGRTLVFLDACFSGSGPRSVLLARRPVLVGRVVSVAPSMIVLAASGLEQESQIYAAKRHGLFTYYLLRGLNGNAADHGHVTIESLYRYVRSRVSGNAHLADGEQTPRLETGGRIPLSTRLR